MSTWHFGGTAPGFCRRSVGSTNQQDAGPQVGVGGSEEEAAAGLQQRARHLYVVVGEVGQQHLSGHAHVLYHRYRHFIRMQELGYNKTKPAVTLRQCSVSVLENILNLASSPMNRTVLFLVSMLIWSFFRIYSTNISATKISCRSQRGLVCLTVPCQSGGPT